MLDEKIVCDKGIFPKLDFQSNTVFYKICLIIAENRSFSGCFNVSFLFPQQTWKEFRE